MGRKSLLPLLQEFAQELLKAIFVPPAKVTTQPHHHGLMSSACSHNHTNVNKTSMANAFGITMQSNQVVDNQINTPASHNKTSHVTPIAYQKKAGSRLQVRKNMTRTNTATSTKKATVSSVAAKSGKNKITNAKNKLLKINKTETIVRKTTTPIKTKKIPANQRPSKKLVRRKNFA